MRHSLQFLIFTACCLMLFAMLPLHASSVRHRADAELKRQAAQLNTLQLTDLCLTTEARYTRNPALSDRHAAFQEHPSALEHFPSGSLILPPAHLRETP